MRFRDRADAGRVLAGMLRDALSRPLVVGGIPRGGLAVALPVARALGAPLVVAHAHKLVSPVSPEFAFGAVDADGEVLLDRLSVRELGLEPADVERARERAWETLRARVDPDPARRLESRLPGAAVLVDDGLATGLTMLAAVRHARRHGASPLVVAVPCASSEAAELLRSEVDRLVCPAVDDDFLAVGEYYERFGQVDDGEMERLLRAAGPEPDAPPGAGA
jgi:putative phosphoribosyl transferase